jgi:hypothetical protein
MAGKIFINYRREDSIAIAGRLRDRLAETFGPDNLFMDVDNIPVGINFEEYLKSQVAACDVVLSVIGPNWLNAKDETDQRRLDKPDDFVAIELAAALARDILVIPVVDGTRCARAKRTASFSPSLFGMPFRYATRISLCAEQLITNARHLLFKTRTNRDLVFVVQRPFGSDLSVQYRHVLNAPAMFFIRSENSSVCWRPLWWPRRSASWVARLSPGTRACGGSVS